MITRVFKKFISAFVYSISGFKFAIKELAFKLELLAGIPAIILAFYSHISTTEKSILIFSIFLMFIVELVNTAIEKIVDRISTKQHTLSKQIKDIASCAVFFSVLNALIVWFIIYFRPILTHFF